MAHIRWRAIDEARLKNMVNRFNAKIRRVSKAHPEIAVIQPDRISYKEMRDDLKTLTREEYNRQMLRLSRYLRRGYEMPYTTKSGVNTTIWQKREIDNAFRSINAKKRALIKKYQPSYERGTMGTIEANNLRPRRNTVEEILPKDWGTYVRNIDYQRGQTEASVHERYKENFLYAIATTVGEESRLYSAVERMDASDIYRYQFLSPLLQIGMISDPGAPEDIDERMLAEFQEIAGNEQALLTGK